MFTSKASKTLLQALVLAVGFVVVGCGAVDRVTNASSLERAKDEKNEETVRRWDAEREARNYKSMLELARKTTNYIWVMHAESVERITKKSATEICEGIGFRLPTRAQLAEAQEDPYLAKAVDENSDFGGVFVADEDGSEKFSRLYVVCLR